MRTHIPARLIKTGVASLVALAVLTSCSSDDEPSSAAEEGRDKSNSSSKNDRNADSPEDSSDDSTDDSGADPDGDPDGDRAGDPDGDRAGDPAADPADEPAYAGLNLADVRDILKRDKTDYANERAKVAAVQEVALGWAACRGTYELYAEWVKSGELGPKPTPPKVKATKSAIKGNREWIDALYAPLADGDRKLARQQLGSDYNCGGIPVAERGDRSLSIGDAVSSR